VFKPLVLKPKCMYDTPDGIPDSNPDSVIQIQNHWVLRKKNMFGMQFLSED
jgi:hypothetical protein